MGKLTTITVAIFMVALISAHGDFNKNKRDIQISTNVNILDLLCQTNQVQQFLGDWCPSTTTTPPPSSTASGTTKPGSTSASSTTSSPSVLQNAYWCRLSNGTYLTRGQTYMQMACVICQCADSHDIVCNTLPCMPTYCIDGTTPKVRTGDCCPTCAYETQVTSCTQGGITFPHGTLIKTIANSTQCWCQAGSIECRRALTTTVYTTWEYFSNNTAIYVAVIVICLILMLGTLLCCGCALLYYYYYQNQQQSIDHAYEQYYSNAGWQPMGEDGQLDDAAAKEKQTEAEQGQFEHQYPTGHSAEFIPPPYAVYNGPYGSGKDQRQV